MGKPGGKNFPRYSGFGMSLLTLLLADGMEVRLGRIFGTYTMNLFCKFPYISRTQRIMLHGNQNNLEFLVFVRPTVNNGKIPMPV